MNRDIKIMENILREMFKVHWTGNTIRSHYGGSQNIRGTYLPGYGVIFTIPGIHSGFTALNDVNKDGSSLYFTYGDGEKGEKVTKESITNKIIEFLQDYGFTISQLSEMERVTVIYSMQPNQFDFVAFRRSEEKKKQLQIPTISVAVARDDIQAYRSGTVSTDEFRDRLEISTSKVKGKNQMDLKVMANIFETTFKRSDGESFHITGPVAYLKLDNFGALFFCNAFSTAGLLSSAYSLKPSDIDSISVQPRKKNGVVSITTKSGERRVYSSGEMLEKRKKQQEQRQKEITEHYQSFVLSLKEHLVDYGRTLRSVGSDQHILVSVALKSRFGRYGDVPERIDMQVQKSILEEMEKGDIKRENAIDQIQVREY